MRRWLIQHRLLLLTIFVAFLGFLPALGGEFLAYDDELLVLDNPKVHGLTAEHIGQAFTTFDPELYVPATLLTYQIEWSLVGDQPWLYHATNIALHLLSIFFVFLMLRRFFSERVSILCALLFALHPIQVEAVAWISGRKDLLASMFFLASCHTYLLWQDRSEGKHKLMSVGLFALGLLAKVSIAPLPVALLLLDYLGDRDITLERIKEKWPYFALSILFLIVAFVGKESAMGASALTMGLLAFASIQLALLHVIFPVGLTIFYPFVDAVSVTHPRIWIGALVLIALVIVGWLLRKKSRMVWFAVLWFLVLIAPSLLTTVKTGELGMADIYLTSDRYAYLALLGPVIFIGWLLSRRVNIAWTAVPVLAIFAFLTFKQIGFWHDSEALFRRVIDLKQPAHVAYTNLGGFAAQEENFAEAEILFEQSLAIRRTPRVIYNLVQIKGALNKPSEARALYDEYMQLRPNDAEARTYLRRFVR